MSYVMIRMVESTHVGFLFNITGKRVRRQADGLWETSAAKEVLRVARMQSATTYIGRRKATVAQWVSLKLLLEVCAWETGYEGGDRKSQPWWRQGTAAEVLRTNLEGASQVRQQRCRYQYGVAEGQE